MEHLSARILVVHDEHASRPTLVLLVEQRRYALVTAASAEAALAAIDQPPFDLLLPGMRASEGARRARALQPTAKLVLVTKRSPLEGAARTDDLAQFDDLLKTASPQNLVQRLAALLTERA